MIDPSHWGRAILAAKELQGPHSCNCIGPQNGQPKCPCMMRGVIQRNGRWIEPERDPDQLTEPHSEP